MWLLAQRRFEPESRGLGWQILILLGILITSLVLLFTAISILENLVNSAGVPMWLMLGFSFSFYLIPKLCFAAK